jgi:hypothetical protein
MPIWQHRDGYWGGGIFFPTSIMRWWYAYGNPVNKYAVGSYDTYLWYYVNENWTISVGPSLRDGDDLWGTNWKRRQRLQRNPDRVLLIHLQRPGRRRPGALLQRHLEPG